MALIALVTASSARWITAMESRQRRPITGEMAQRQAQEQGAYLGSSTGAEAPKAVDIAATNPLDQPTNEAGDVTRAVDRDAPRPDDKPAGPPAPAQSGPSRPAEEADYHPARDPRESVARDGPPQEGNWTLNGSGPARTEEGLRTAEADSAGPPCPLHSDADRSLGRTLFSRKWRPSDPRCHGGDGLGPLYNATSCLDCHRLGGPGGAGLAKSNVELLTVIGNAVPRGRPTGMVLGLTPKQTDPDYLVQSFFGNRPSPATQADMLMIHPGFSDGRSIVLHRYGVDPRYASWRQNVKAEFFAHGMAVAKNQRNAPPLFGAGLIDAVPDTVFSETARRQPPEIRGRVHRLKDGQIGRFGWKAQTATLHDFVLAACANELGLEVPDHHQAASPLQPLAEAKSLDLTADECEALVAYVGGLSRPVEITPTEPGKSRDVDAGRRLFTAIGCAGCHTPDLGSIPGIYSDLLLHSMGEALGDHGTYYGVESPGGALDTEWRTPPLWGIRDSGPYLHDGRASSLAVAIAQHGGQGAESARRFHVLTRSEQFQLLSFLRSLAAPAPEAQREVTAPAAEEAQPRAAEASPRSKPTPHRSSLE